MYRGKDIFCLQSLQTRLLLCLSLLLASPTLAQKSPREEARRLMERVFAYPDSIGVKPRDYGADIYAQFGFRTRKGAGIVRFMPQFFRFERGTHDYYGEDLLRVDIHQDAPINIHEKAFFSTHPRSDKVRIAAASNYLPTLYESHLLQDRLLSPLNRRNRRYYRYTLQRLRTDTAGVTTARIAIVPRFYNTQLVSGFAEVDTLTGAVKDYSFSFFYAMMRARISGSMGAEGVASLFPSQFNVALRSSLLGNKLTVSSYGFADYNFPSSPDSAASGHKGSHYDLTARYLLRLDKSRTVQSEAYFDATRPYPLSAGARRAYDDARRQRLKLHADSVVADTHEGTIGQTINFLLDRHNLALGSGGNLRVPAIISPEMFSWSKRKGFQLQTRMRAKYDFSPFTSLSFTPKASYSFGLKQFYWRVPLTLSFVPRYDMSVNIEAGKGNHLYSSRQADDVRQALRGTDKFEELDRLLSHYDFNFYRDLYVRTEYALSPVAGLRLEGGIRYHRRSLVGWGQTAIESGMKRYIRSFAPRFHVDWTPGQYYYRETTGRKVPLYSHWPTLRFDYERGISIGGFHSRYERFEFDAAYVLRLYALRSLFFRGGAGLYTHRGGGYFLDYDYFSDNNLPSGWEDEMSGKFYALGSRWYNESRHYLRFSATYESPMMLFSRLKWLSRVVSKERIYGNVVSLAALHPYAEIGYGLSTHILDVSGFIGLAPHRDATLGARLMLHW